MGWAALLWVFLVRLTPLLCDFCGLINICVVRYVLFQLIASFCDDKNCILHYFSIKTKFILKAAKNYNVYVMLYVLSIMNYLVQTEPK